VDAIERALEIEAGYEKVMHLLASTRLAMSGLMCEVIEDHVRTHLADQEIYPGALNNDGAEELLAVVRTYLK
jgi:DNA-binding FrmR family transcriptional regulator